MHQFRIGIRHRDTHRQTIQTQANAFIECSRFGRRLHGALNLIHSVADTRFLPGQSGHADAELTVAVALNHFDHLLSHPDMRGHQTVD